MSLSWHHTSCTWKLLPCSCTCTRCSPKTPRRRRASVDASAFKTIQEKKKKNREKKRTLKNEGGGEKKGGRGERDGGGEEEGARERRQEWVELASTKAIDSKHLGKADRIWGKNHLASALWSDHTVIGDEVLTPRARAHTHIHIHTHTQREREGEGERERPWRNPFFSRCPLPLS